VDLSGKWPGAARIIALEAKLARWRDALKQARAYRRFADQSYVVLPERAMAAALEAKEEFRCAGVGLLAATRGRLVIAIPPERARDHDWRREFVCSRIGPNGRLRG